MSESEWSNYFTELFRQLVINEHELSSYWSSKQRSSASSEMGHFHQMGFVWASYCGALRSQFDLSGLSQTSVTPKSEDGGSRGSFFRLPNAVGHAA